ncbi:MAG TPA: exodeoxyribonuclease V subunit gamma [Burkholderiaceae bacterium]|nr:exodeoxyribonuclease V subunit gamma [Burkholderiaceae bacterium]
MALHVRFEARLDRLAHHLTELLAVPVGGPLADDIVIVPSLGEARWLQQRVARQLGISAGWRPEFAGRYLWRLLADVFPELPARSPFDPDLSRWTLMSLLGDLPALDELAPLRQRLAQAPLADRFDLASDIAAHFDRYLAYRRDWLVRWQAGLPAQGDAPLSPHEGWQRWLWNALLERLPGISTVHPYDRLLAALTDDPLGVARRLRGRRVMLFGAVAMSPEQFTLFGVLAHVIDVHVFAPDPCREFWHDMVTPRARAEVALLQPDQAWLYDGEPAVLAHWGRAQRDFGVQVMDLAERCGVAIEEPLRDQAHAFADPQAEVPAAPSSLQALQLSVFLASDASWAGCAGPDRSLQAHSTHGLMRSAEVLHDALLECFDEMPDLQPHEVAVFCADLDAALPALQSVFASAPGARAIPVSISGRRASADPLFRALTELWGLARMGVPVPALARWLDNPVLMHTLGLDDNDVARLLELFCAAGARWGMSPERGPAKHSWRAALDRLLLGAALGPTPEHVGDEVSVPGLRAGSSEPLLPWLRVHEALDRLDAAIGLTQPVAQWCELAGWLADQLLAGDHPWRDSMQRLHDALARLREGCAHEPSLLLDAAGFEQALGDALEGSAQVAAPGSSVTVCPLGGLRGVPWRVVALFGMDESAWPRSGTRGEFDLIARGPRFGDRLSRTDDRGVFLDSLLACDERLLVIYQGRDARDDAVLNPSPVVAELLDYVVQQCPGTSTADWVLQQPVHRFSRASFQGERPTYDADWLPAARALTEPLAQRAQCLGPFDEMPGDTTPFDATPCDETPCDETPGGDTPGAEAAADPQVAPVVLLDDLSRDLVDPHHHWWNVRFGMRLPFESEALAETEPLGEPLEKDAAILTGLVAGLVSGRSDDELVRETAVLPALASGQTGRYQARQLLAAARRLLAPVTAFLRPEPAKAGARVAAPPPQVEPETLERMAACCQRLDLEARVDGVVVRGQALLFPALGLQLVVSGYRLGPRTGIDGWLAHALWGCALPSSGSRTTLALASSGWVTVSADLGADALRHALAVRRAAGERPLPLFPHACRAAGEHEGERALAAVEEALIGNERTQRGALSRPWPGAFYRDSIPDLSAVLEASRAAYGPIFSQCVEKEFK